MKSSARCRQGIILMGLGLLLVMTSCPNPFPLPLSGGISLLSTSPGADALDIPLNTAVQAVFSETLEPASVTGASVTVWTGGYPVTGTVEADGASAIFRPASPFSSGTVYTVTLSGAISGISGKTLSDNRDFTFTTGFGSDTIPPVVVVANPSMDEKAASIDTAIKITFSEAIDPLTVTADSLKINGKGAEVAGTAVATGADVTFTPSSPLLPRARYTVTLSSDIKDLAGNPLVAALFAFRTTVKAFPDVRDPDPGQYIDFGGVVAQDNATTAIAAVSYEDCRVCVFERDANGIPASLAALRSPEFQPGDAFGCSIAVSGDILLVGAKGEDGTSDSPYEDYGAVYVFERSGGAWTQTAVLRADGAASGDGFGCSVSLDGNYAIIGAGSKNSGSMYGCGAAYVFERIDADTWIQKPALFASNRQKNAQFGGAVALSGNFAIVGAKYHDYSYDIWINTGAAYVFERDAAGAWIEKAILYEPQNWDHDQFGCAVSMDGNYAVIGSLGTPRPGNIDNQCGAAYVFERNNLGNWYETAALNAPDGVYGDCFGKAVSISGALAVVAAPKSWNSPARQGAVYIFERDESGAWPGTDIIRFSPGWLSDSAQAVSVSSLTLAAGVEGDKTVFFFGL